jgi:hypothetical protein
LKGWDLELRLEPIVIYYYPTVSKVVDEPPVVMLTSKASLVEMLDSLVADSRKCTFDAFFS